MFELDNVKNEGILRDFLSFRRIRTRRFRELTCRPSGATNRLKNTMFRDFSAFSCTHLTLFSSDSFSSLIFFLLLFSSLLFSDSSHLCFRSVHIVGSLTSKLPSITRAYISCNS